MLDPYDRSLLFDSLRPPLGYRLDVAVGTTFSLDLITLLTVPLAFTLFDWCDEKGAPAADPLALLESLRRTAGRMTIFCQTGRIAVPPRQLLLSNLEDSVVQVQAPKKGGVFHPKIWALRFVPTEGSDSPIVYRLVCSSRNITFDRSWDTVVILDGPVSTHPRSLRVNRPLADFIKRLPGLAAPTTGENALTRARSLTSEVATEIQRAKFELPDNFDEFHFWPLGMDEHSSWPFGDQLDRLAIVSPFVSDNTLQRLADQAKTATLVSRVENLQATNPETVDQANFEEVFYMDTAADAEDIHEGETPEDDQNENKITASPEHETLSGLHAKIYLADRGSNGHLWTGSANATNAAFNRNVEFLVELKGQKRHCGVSVFLGEDDDVTKFRRLLIPFSHSETVEPALMQQLETNVDNFRTHLSSRAFVAEATNNDTKDTFDVVLRVSDGKKVKVPAGMTLRSWPTTLQENQQGIDFTDHFTRAVFRSISFPALTSFFAFRVTAEHEGLVHNQTFVLNVPLLGAPANRHDRLLLTILHNRQQVLRYLLLLLADEGDDVRGILDSLNEPNDDEDNTPTFVRNTAPLLEPLVRALATDIGKLDRIQQIVEDLGSSEEGQDLLPDRFDEVWAPIWDVRKSMKDTKPV